jgi:hypothetical protein
MVQGNFTVTASDAAGLIVGETYALSIDDAQVDIQTVVTTTVLVTAEPVVTPDPTPDSNTVSGVGAATA